MLPPVTVTAVAAAPTKRLPMEAKAIQEELSEAAPAAVWMNLAEEKV